MPLQRLLVMLANDVARLQQHRTSEATKNLYNGKVTTNK